MAALKLVPVKVRKIFFYLDEIIIWWNKLEMRISRKGLEAKIWYKKSRLSVIEVTKCSVGVMMRTWVCVRVDGCVLVHGGCAWVCKCVGVWGCLCIWERETESEKTLWEERKKLIEINRFFLREIDRVIKTIIYHYNLDLSVRAKRGLFSKTETFYPVWIKLTNFLGFLKEFLGARS